MTQEEILKKILYITALIKCVLMLFIYCCAYVLLWLGKNIFTFIWWFVNLCLLLIIVKRKNRNYDKAHCRQN